jgi:flavin-binding protein dodecin
MSYSKKFTGATKEEALQKANDFLDTLDVVEQGSIWGVVETNNQWVVQVKYYGFD